MIPEIDGPLRKNRIHVPEGIGQASGIRLFGKLVKSFAFTTDVAMIRNIDANAIMAVHPFAPQPIILQAVLSVSDMPVLCGVGGGIIQNQQVLELARYAEFQGAMGIVANTPTMPETLRLLKEHLEIPIVLTVTSTKIDLEERIAAGVDCFNVSAAANTPEVVRNIRENYPDFPIIATGGPSDKTIQETIQAGANAISYTPPATADVFRDMMNKYRQLF